MITSRPVSRTFRALMIATALGLALPSCALFKPERVALRSTALETLPPTPISLRSDDRRHARRSGLGPDDRLPAGAAESGEPGESELRQR